MKVVGTVTVSNSYRKISIKNHNRNGQKIGNVNITVWMVKLVPIHVPIKTKFLVSEPTIDIKPAPVLNKKPQIC